MSDIILLLNKMGIRLPVVAKIRSKAGISVYRVNTEGESFVLKVFDNEEDRRELENYRMLSSAGIPVLPVIKQTEDALLLPDVMTSDKLRLGVESDLSDVNSARAIARWYRLLHDRGGGLLSGIKQYDETDVIEQANMSFIAGKTETSGNPFWLELDKNFTEVRRLIDLLPRTLTYNDFYWTNLIVAKDGSSAMMLDFNLLGHGYAYGDLRNVTSSLSGDAKDAFLQEYGEYTIEGEKIADTVIAPIVNLYFACKHEKFPAWAAESLDELNSGELLDNLRRWLVRKID